MSNDDFVYKEIPGLSPFFTIFHWHEWTCVNFLKFVRRGRTINIKEKPKLHQAYKQSFRRIQPTVPEKFIEAFETLELSLVNIHFFG